MSLILWLCCQKKLFYHGGCYIFIASRFAHLIMSPNIMTTEKKGIGYQGIRATEAFEHENTRIDLKYCYF